MASEQASNATATSPQALAQLRVLSDTLGAPGEQRLFQAAQRKGIRVTRADVRGFMQTNSQRQLFRPLQRSAGKSATDGPSDRYQMDLAQIDRERLFLVVVSVFSRKVWARPVPSKEPAAVAPVLREILQAIPHAVKVMSSDQGQEFSREVKELLEERGITHKLKFRDDVNSLSVADRQIQGLKQTMARMFAARPGGDFEAVLRAAVQAHNETVHSTVRDTPNDLESDTASGKVLQFMAMRDNAARFAHNAQLTERRKEKLENAGAFRRPLRGLTKFQRSFYANYGDVERLPRNADGAVEYTTGTLLKAGEGPLIDIKRVQAVAPTSANLQPALAATNPRDRHRRAGAQDLVAALREFLEESDTGERSIQAASTHLRERMGSSEYETALGGRRLAQIIALFPGDFELTQNNVYVRLL